MKKVLTILTTIVLGSNTALLVTKPIDQGQKLDGIEGSPIFAQTITKNDNLIKDNSKQLTAGFIIEIIKMINKNRFSFEYSKITVENLEESENSAKSQIKSKFISFIKSKVKDLSHLDFDFKFINFISPKEFSLRETAPGFIEAKIGIKSTLEKEFLWSDFFLFKILFLPVIKIPDMENIVISSRYNEYGFSDGVSYHDTLYFVNHNRVFSYNQKSGNVELAMQIKNKIVTNGVVYDNKLYFAADDYYVYGYNPRNNQVNKILKASNLIKSNGIVVENKLYFGSDDYCLYEYDAETNVVKVVLTADAEIRHSGTVYNNKLYFGTENGDFYVYDLKTNSFKVWKANDEVTVSDSGVIVNDSIYFTGIMKDKSSIYKLDLKTNLIWTWTFILPGKYISSIMFLNNKIYFFMTSIGNQAPILYEFDGNRIHWIESVHFLEMTRSCLKGIVYDNAIYLTHTTLLYKFTPEQNKGEIVFNSNASKSLRFLELNTCGIILNDKIYYGTFWEGIIEYNLRNNF